MTTIFEIRTENGEAFELREHALDGMSDNALTAALINAFAMALGAKIAKATGRQNAASDAMMNKAIKLTRKAARQAWGQMREGDNHD